MVKGAFLWSKARLQKISESDKGDKMRIDFLPKVCNEHKLCFGAQKIIYVHSFSTSFKVSFLLNKRKMRKNFKQSLNIYVTT